jgi:hypothetical protein
MVFMGNANMIGDDLMDVFSGHLELDAKEELKYTNYNEWFIRYLYICYTRLKA